MKISHFNAVVLKTESNDFRSLREVLAREYDLAESPISFGGRSFLFTSVSDSYALLDRITPEEFLRDEQMPYWAEIWPSSLALASFLGEEVQMQGVRAIELGAGVGVVSIVAAALGERCLRRITPQKRSGSSTAMPMPMPSGFESRGLTGAMSCSRGNLRCCWLPMCSMSGSICCQS